MVVQTFVRMTGLNFLLTHNISTSQSSSGVYRQYVYMVVTKIPRKGVTGVYLLHITTGLNHVQLLWLLYSNSRHTSVLGWATKCSYYGIVGHLHNYSGTHNIHNINKLVAL